MRTGDRPALNERGQPRTGSRTALPAATFADAITDPKKGGKVSTAAETLVMPKVQTPEPPVMTRGGKTREMPALRDGAGQGTPEASLEGREGRSVKDMDSPVGRGGTRIVRMPDLAAGKGRAEGGEEGKELRRGKGGETTRIGKAPEKDNFGTTPTTGNRPTFRTSQVKGPVRPVRELIPPGLGKLGDQVAVAKRFASDLPLLHQQVRPSDLPPSDRALRLWAFFTAYAAAAASKESTPEGQELFDKTLEKEGFGELRDKHTGQDGVKAGKWVLEAPNAKEARERAGQVELEPPPEVLLSESAQAQKSEAAQEALPKPENAQAQDTPRKPEDAPRSDAQSLELKDSASSQGTERAPLERADKQSEFVRVNPQLADMPRPVMLPVNPELERRQEDESRAGNFEDAWKKLSGNLKLGGNMLWNVLHRFRNGEEDSAIEKEKWNQIAFAAVLAFVGLMLLVILVVSL